MTPANSKILVQCDPGQKETMVIAGQVFRCATDFEYNYRYKSPTLCTVVEGNDVVQAGDVLVVHHNLLYLPSPYHVESNLFSVPFSKVLFAKVKEDGTLQPICGNILGSEIEKTYAFPVPPEAREKHKDRILVEAPGDTPYRAGQVLLTRPSAPYVIIWHWAGERRQVAKVSADMVVGYVQ